MKNKTFCERLNEIVPCKITGILHSDDLCLSIDTESWTFGTVDNWRVRNKKRVLFTCDEDDQESIVENLQTLVGYTIVDISIKYSDIYFQLSDGRTVEVFVTSPYDAWTFDLDDTIFVPDTFAEYGGAE